jgi:hypothetical protein
MGSQKQKYNRTRHDFLLTLFPDKQEKYAVLKMNGFVLVRQFDGNVKLWEVAIYREDSFKKVEEYKKGFKSRDKNPHTTTLF